MSRFLLKEERLLSQEKSSEKVKMTLYMMTALQARAVIMFHFYLSLAEENQQ
jgi:hypothetical protein